MPKQIFVTSTIPDVGIQLLKEKGYDVEVRSGDALLSKEDLIAHLKLKPYDAVVTLLTDRIDAAVFDAAPSVKLYVNYASGYDNIDVVEAKKRGITVANAPADGSAEAVAEHTIALMLALAARIVEADQYVRDGKYQGWQPMNFIGSDILGKTLGLIGAGRIGNRVAHYARALGMQVIYHDTVRNEQLERDCAASQAATIEKLLSSADVVSLHVPLLDSTRHLINGTALSAMKPTAFLINTSRGPVVDEVALEEALRNHRIGGAALDVFEFEPKTVPGLTNLGNVILTPHIASASREAREQMADIAALNVIDFFEKGVPRNVITT
jgi:glyoxylate reductase